MFKTELGFDVLEVAQQRYASDSYHDFIGFQVVIPLLERAFQETYGLPLKAVLSNEDKVLNSYRRAVSKQIPEANADRLDAEERRNPERCTRDHQKEIPLQPLSCKL
jgi:hypothetical protein